MEGRNVNVNIYRERREENRIEKEVGFELE
jgi:hypothetical protein